MFQFWIIRSGITEFDRQRRVMGNLDVPLHTDADQEIEAIISQMNDHPIEMVYTSPGQSSVETAERLCRAWGVKYKPLDLLQNINLGLWQGLLLEEVKHKQPKVFRQWQEHPETVCPPEGEMFQMARERIDGFLAKAYRKHKTGVVAVVVPDPFATLLVSVLHQKKIKDICQIRSDRDENIQIISPSLTNA